MAERIIEHGRARDLEEVDGSGPNPHRRLALRYVIFTLLLPVTAAAAYIFLPQPTPAYPDLLSLDEAYDVRILRDTWGVPHIFGRTDADTAFGLAYAHAEDDFLTIQQTLVAARGHLAAVYGPDAAPNDYMVHLLRIWDVVEAEYTTQLSVDTRAVLESYADGLNFYAARNPEEVLDPELFPLSGKDLAAASVHRSPLFFGLDSVLSDLFADERKSPVSGEAPSPASLPPNQTAWEKSVAGSNTFALAPSRTTDGSTFFAVNSHQPWEGPVAWYEAHVHSDQGWDMAGALFPGAPVIIHGANRNLAWAFTVNSPDLVDVYVLQTHPENENLYMFDGEWRELEVRRAAIDVNLIGRLTVPVQQEFLWSVYGPVVRRPHGTYAIRYAGMGRLDIWEQLYRMNRAEDFSTWQEALRRGGLPMFNVGYADREGNIYYVYNALLPLRAPGYDWSLYLPGTSSEVLWTDILPFDQLPQVFNPTAGYIQNANSSPFQTSLTDNPDPNGFDPSFGIETTMTNRSLRLHELLGGKNRLTFEQFIAVKWDMKYSLDSNIPAYIDSLLQMSLDDPAMQQAQELLQRWDLRVNPENRSAALGVLTLNFINDRYDPFRPSAMVGLPIPDDILRDAFRQAVDHLLEHFGRLDPTWAEVNRLQRGNLNIGVGGGPDILHAVYGRLDQTGRFIGTAGDGVVVLVRWYPDGTLEAWSIHQYGAATLDETSPHFSDQALLFSERRLKPVWMDETDILAHLEAAYPPGEEQP